MTPSDNHTTAIEKAGSKKTKSKGRETFPLLLHRMLQEVDEANLNGIVSWVPSNDSFKVHDKERFMTDILPRYARQTQYKSFVRQLNLWGFACIQHGPERGSYTHEHFVRGRSDYVTYMKRIKIKGAFTKIRKLNQDDRVEIGVVQCPRAQSNAYPSHNESALREQGGSAVDITSVSQLFSNTSTNYDVSNHINGSSNSLLGFPQQLTQSNNEGFCQHSAAAGAKNSAATAAGVSSASAAAFDFISMQLPQYNYDSGNTTSHNSIPGYGISTNTVHQEYHQYRQNQLPIFCNIGLFEPRPLHPSHPIRTSTSSSHGMH